MSTAIVWLRQDLRLADNPALHAAVASGARVVPVWIDEPVERGASQIGAAARVWLHHSLIALGKHLKQHKLPLLLAQGDALPTLEALVTATGATALYWNRRYDPESIVVDKAVKAHFSDLSPKTFKGGLLHEPWEVLKGDGDPYRVYTPYWRRVAARLIEEGLPEPLDAPKKFRAWKLSDFALDKDPGNRFHTDVDALGLMPALPWGDAMIEAWPVGEQGARERLEQFLSDGTVYEYGTARDLPAIVGTSRLSPALHHGEISPRQIMHRLLDGRRIDALDDDETTFAKEVVWREFAHSLLYHFPQTLHSPLDRRFERFVWATDQDEPFVAWCRGQTGVPIIDAGMRQLYATGWMHNRVRMIVASYLVKNLLIPWQRGEAWFRDTLVDADAASNTFGWQWAAGCGADAAPYFRVFNPVLQGEKFDKKGAYVRHWVPEITELPDKFVHKPWECPDEMRAALDYPAPLVDLKASRLRALDAFAIVKSV